MTIWNESKKSDSMIVAVKGAAEKTAQMKFIRNEAENRETQYCVNKKFANVEFKP